MEDLRAPPACASSACGTRAPPRRRDRGRDPGRHIRGRRGPARGPPGRACRRHPAVRRERRAGSRALRRDAAGAAAPARLLAQPRARRTRARRRGAAGRPRPCPSWPRRTASATRCGSVAISAAISGIIDITDPRRPVQLSEWGIIADSRLDQSGAGGGDREHGRRHRRLRRLLRPQRARRRPGPHGIRLLLGRGRARVRHPRPAPSPARGAHLRCARRGGDAHSVAVLDAGRKRYLVQSQEEVDPLSPPVVTSTATGDGHLPAVELPWTPRPLTETGALTASVLDAGAGCSASDYDGATGKLALVDAQDLAQSGRQPACDVGEQALLAGRAGAHGVLVNFVSPGPADDLPLRSPRRRSSARCARRHHSCSQSLSRRSTGERPQCGGAPRGPTGAGDARAPAPRVRRPDRLRPDRHAAGPRRHTDLPGRVVVHRRGRDGGAGPPRAAERRDGVGQRAQRGVPRRARTRRGTPAASSRSTSERRRGSAESVSSRRQERRSGASTSTRRDRSSSPATSPAGSGFSGRRAENYAGPTTSTGLNPSLQPSRPLTTARTCARASGRKGTIAREEPSRRARATVTNVNAPGRTPAARHGSRAGRGAPRRRSPPRAEARRAARRRPARGRSTPCPPTR